MKIEKNTQGNILIKNEDNSIEHIIASESFVQKHPRNDNAVLISTTASNQHENDSIVLYVDQVTEVAGASFSGDRDELLTQLATVFRRGGGDGGGSQLTNEKVFLANLLDAEQDLNTANLSFRLANNTVTTDKIGLENNNQNIRFHEKGWYRLNYRIFNHNPTAIKYYTAIERRKEGIIPSVLADNPTITYNQVGDYDSLQRYSENLPDTFFFDFTTANSFDNNQRVLFETGGNGIGFSVFQQENTISISIGDNNDVRDVAAWAVLKENTKYVMILELVSKDVLIYLAEKTGNDLPPTIPLVAERKDWGGSASYSGGDKAGVGKPASSVQGQGNFNSYNGTIHEVRFYSEKTKDDIWTDEQTISNLLESFTASSMEGQSVSGSSFILCPDKDDYINLKSIRLSSADENVKVYADQDNSFLEINKFG